MAFTPMQTQQVLKQNFDIAIVAFQASNIIAYTLLQLLKVFDLSPLAPNLASLDVYYIRNKEEVSIKR